MRSDARAGRRALAILFAVALVLRLAAIFALKTPQVATHASVWQWGHEASCLAQSIVDGHDYGNPWAKGSGASSWLTPPFPALIALLFTCFGGLSYASALALFALQAIASAATCVLIAILGSRAGRPRAGKLGAWMFAFYPLAIVDAAQLVWDTTFVAFALTAFLVLLVRARATRASSIGLGLAYGAVVFLNPAPLSIAPPVLWWIWSRGDDSRRAAVNVACFAVAAFAVCAPWMIRNQRVLGAFSLRPNFGVELRIGNRDGANGHPMPTVSHPSHVLAEFERYQELGEVAYARESTERARAWIAEHPGGFAALTARRAQLFWLGEWPASDPRKLSGESSASDPVAWIKFLAYALLGMGGLFALIALPFDRSLRRVFEWSVLLFGGPYYVTHVSERYRFPIDPLLALLCATLVVSLYDRRRARRSAT